MQALIPWIVVLTHIRECDRLTASIETMGFHDRTPAAHLTACPSGFSTIAIGFI